MIVGHCHLQSISINNNPVPNHYRQHMLQVTDSCDTKTNSLQLRYPAWPFLSNQGIPGACVQASQPIPRGQLYPGICYTYSHARSCISKYICHLFASSSFLYLYLVFRIWYWYVLIILISSSFLESLLADIQTVREPRFASISTGVVPPVGSGTSSSALLCLTRCDSCDLKVGHRMQKRK